MTSGTNGDAPNPNLTLLGEEKGAHPGGFNAATGRPEEEGGFPPQYAFPPLTFDCIQGEDEAKFPRRKCRTVMIGKVAVGGDAPISVQSMTKTDPGDLAANVKEVLAMQAAGADLIRVSLPHEWDVQLVQHLKQNGMTVPFIADVHFSYRIALQAIEAGVDKLRLNPGNIEKPEYVKHIAREARDAGIAMRIGINSGSIPKDLLAKYNGHRIPAMIEGAQRHIAMLEDEGFFNIIVAVKASDAPTMIRAYRAMAARCDYPLHLGVTESGTPWAGTIRSTAGMATLLSEGIGDTIRVSLTTTKPEEEVRVGIEILRALGLRKPGVTIISCPTCGRIEIDVEKIAAEVEARVGTLDFPLKVSIMGCVVNGPGEAAEADVALFGGKNVGMIYRGGDQVARMNETEMVDSLVREITKMKAEWEAAGRPEQGLKDAAALTYSLGQ
ncbi:MAG: flavodoxin-dependent (E)-4-hydroxy-3-methylbut-2-enyl-diphosphate synthase [bacterium]